MNPTAILPQLHRTNVVVSRRAPSESPWCSACRYGRPALVTSAAVSTKRVVQMRVTQSSLSLPPLLRSFGRRAAPVPEPQGDDADTTLYRLSLGLLALPTVAAAAKSEVLLETLFNLESNDPTELSNVSTTQHFANIFGSDCFCLLALAVLYSLSGR